MAKASMFGLMVRVIKVSLLRERDMVKAVGNQQKIMAIYTLELIKTIRKTDMVVMYGQMVVCTREVLQMMSSTFVSI